MLAGAYNLGFIALGAWTPTSCLDWWSERLEHDCLIDPERARFVDQRWIDLVPGLFEPTSCATTRVQRRLLEPPAPTGTWDGERYLVDGQPLRFFHYSGFDPNKPWLLSKFQGPKPAVLLSDRPDLQRLCLEYRTKC